MRKKILQLLLIVALLLTQMIGFVTIVQADDEDQLFYNRLRVDRIRMDSWHHYPSHFDGWRDYSAVYERHRGNWIRTNFGDADRTNGAGRNTVDDQVDYHLIDIDFGRVVTVGRVELDRRDSIAGQAIMTEVRAYSHDHVGSSWPVSEETWQFMGMPGNEIDDMPHVSDAMIAADFDMRDWNAEINIFVDGLIAVPTADTVTAQVVAIYFNPPIETQYIRFAVSTRNAEGDFSHLQLAVIRAFSDQIVSSYANTVNNRIHYVEGVMRWRLFDHGNRRFEVEESPVFTGLHGAMCLQNVLTFQEIINDVRAELSDETTEEESAELIARLNTALSVFMNNQVLNVDNSALNMKVNRMFPVMDSEALQMTALTALWGDQRARFFGIANDLYRTNEILADAYDLMDVYADLADAVAQLWEARTAAVAASSVPAVNAFLVEQGAQTATTVAEVAQLTTALQQLAAGEIDAPDVDVAAQDQQPPANQQDQSTDSAEDDDSNMMLIIIIVSAVVVIGIIVFVVLKKKQ